MNSEDWIIPVYIYSMPRSGSTLLQRMVATYDEVSTSSEPWLLLPLLYAIKEDGGYSEYSHYMSYIGISEFVDKLPNGKQDYLDSMQLGVLDVYRKAAGSHARFYVDKTPRYALVCDEIVRMFPTGKHIFLWRNPLSIIASMIESFNHGLWRIFHSRVDLYEGMEKLIKTYEHNKEKAISIRYEDIVNSPKETMEIIAKYLDVEFRSDAIERFEEVVLDGSMGDHTGRYRYDSISVDPIDKWKESLSSPVRKMWCKRYLQWLGSDRLESMGYDLDGILLELDAIPTRWGKAAMDAVNAVYGGLYIILEFKIMKDKLRKLSGGKRVYKNT